MMKWLMRCILLIGLLLMAWIVSAQEIKYVDTFIPSGINDPRVNDIANACYYGGTLSGKCDTTDVDGDKIITALDRDWMWRAGWHLIRYEYNVVTREDFEPTYLPILPPDYIRKIDGRDGCYGIVGGYIAWGGGTEVRDVKVYQNDLCMGEFSRMDDIVAIETFEEADAICKDQLGLNYYAQRFSRSFFKCELIP